MTINVMDKYIEITKEYIIKYMKLIFEYKYDKTICGAYISKYIKARYYHYFGNEKIEGVTLRKKIMEILKKEEFKLIRLYPEKIKLINNMCLFFYYIMYFDNVIHTKDISKQIDNIYKLEIKFLNKDNEQIRLQLQNLLIEWEQKRKELLDKFETKEFFVEFTKYPEVKNIYRVNLKYNIKFPMIYSDLAIDKAFNTGTIKEDKLYIEYYLTTIKIIQDIIKQDLEKQYIVEFAETLLKKNKKIKGILNILDNAAIQEKINLKIQYKSYKENKEEIHELMRNGFKIAIILDDSFEINYSNIERLGMFNYIIVNKSGEIYPRIIQNKDKIKNLIEI